MRKKPTSRFRGTDLFSRRIVITIPRSGVLLIALAVLVSFATPAIVSHILTLFAVILSITALITIVEARFQLRTFRYEVEAKIVAQLEEWTVPEDLPDLRTAVDTAFDDLDDDAKTRFVWLPKSGRK